MYNIVYIRNTYMVYRDRIETERQRVPYRIATSVAINTT